MSQNRLADIQIQATRRLSLAGARLIWHRWADHETPERVSELAAHLGCAQRRNDMDSNARMLARVNEVAVSTDEMLEFLTKCNELRSEVQGFEGQVSIAASLHPGDSQKVSALMFRMEALARLLAREGAPGWALPGPDGALLTQEAVFAAAAAEPLEIRDEEVEFNRARFLNRVLALAEIGGGEQ